MGHSTDLHRNATESARRCTLRLCLHSPCHWMTHFCTPAVSPRTPSSLAFSRGSSVGAQLILASEDRRAGPATPRGAPYRSRARRGVASRGDEQSRDARRAVPLFLKLAMLDESAAVLRKQARRHSLVRRLSFVQLRRLAGYMWRACFPRKAGRRNRCTGTRGRAKARLGVLDAAKEGPSQPLNRDWRVWLVPLSRRRC